MDIKITMKELTNERVRGAFNKLLGYMNDPKLTYRASRIAKKLKTEQETIEEARITCIKKHKGVLTEIPDFPGRTYYKFPGTENDAFEDEWRNFIKDIVTIDNITPIPFALHVKVGLSGQEIADLGSFIEEPTDEELAALDKEEKKPKDEPKK